MQEYQSLDPSRIPSMLSLLKRQEIYQEFKNQPHVRAKLDMLKYFEIQAGTNILSKKNRWSSLVEDQLNKRDNLAASGSVEAGMLSLLDL